RQRDQRPQREQRRHRSTAATGMDDIANRERRPGEQHHAQTGRHPRAVWRRHGRHGHVVSTPGPGPASDGAGRTTGIRVRGATPRTIGPAVRPDDGSGWCKAANRSTSTVTIAESFVKYLKQLADGRGATVAIGSSYEREREGPAGDRGAGGPCAFPAARGR